MVVLTIEDGLLQVLLVQRGLEPSQRSWALPGGFKCPYETLDEAARELREETSIQDAPTLRQLGAYGDPGRDPRMNVVTVAYLAVVREVGEIVAGSDAAGVALVPVADALDGTLELAFDHGRILADGVERARVDLEQPGLAISFVGTTFTLAELQAVYDAVWGVTLDPANSRRALVAEDGWIVPTGKCAQPGPAGGKPAELYRAGRSWAYGSPIRRPRRARREKGAK